MSEYRYMKPKPTALLESHKQLGAKMAPFGGWLMPIQYESILAEHQHTRTACSLFDTCHMGEFMLTGENAEGFVDGLVTTQLAKIDAGKSRYGFMLNDAGGIIDDLIVFKITDDEWMLVVNAGTIESDTEHVQTVLEDKCRFENTSETTGKLDLQGPLSRDVLADFTGSEGDRLKSIGYFQFDHFDVLGKSCLISRTGYTGELGYEIFLSASRVRELWDLLLADERVKPAGLGARDTLRLEMCYPLYGQDLTAEITPLEAGFEKLLDFNKSFIGRETLIQQKSDGIEQVLTAFVAESRRAPRHESRRAPRHGYEIVVNGKVAGSVTSGTFSPSLSQGIGMGYLPPELSEPGTKILLRRDNVEIPAVVAEKPLYKQGTARL
jgi:aminomethyltransferase